MSIRKIIDKIRLSRDLIRRRIGIVLFDNKNSGEVDFNQLKRIVIFRLDAKIGDSIVSSFVYRGFKRRFPNVIIDVITTTEMSDMYKSYFDVDNVYLSKKRPGYSEIAKIADKVAGADLVVHFSKSLKMKDLFFLKRLNGKAVAGLDDEVNLVNIKLGNKTKDQHFSYKYKALLEYYNITDFDESYVIPNSKKCYAEVASELNLAEDYLIVINPFGSGTPRKLSKQKLQELISRIRSLELGVKIAFTVSPAEKSIIEELVEGNSDVCLLLDSCHSIYHAIALISMADLVISVDTSMVHIASGLNKKLIALYNPDMNNYNEWAPKSDQFEVIFSKENHINGVEIDKVVAGVELLMAAK
ncbi:glycosyltransferase family 9 protein [Photobacterium chitinilyticum]|uniref:Lipopolysaccharide heptosyltransferase family protein n=1 Tax=Photobacterium chitinilyticum TaxID=2485123 RepID=A0A3S3UHX4_9GAMM|nr:glycosyltransferase family 9 protein [Photobacterium chitinilyticum]RWX54373.1 lipopolysaccharide heptosyltransferase family protein [Photobacterium chitinilyticum]